MSITRFMLLVVVDGVRDHRKLLWSLLTFELWRAEHLRPLDGALMETDPLIRMGIQPARSVSRRC